MMSMESDQQGGLFGNERNYALLARCIEFSVIGITSVINAPRFLISVVCGDTCDDSRPAFSDDPLMSRTDPIPDQTNIWK